MPRLPGGHTKSHFFFMFFHAMHFLTTRTYLCHDVTSTYSLLSAYTSQTMFVVTSNRLGGVQVMPQQFLSKWIHLRISFRLSLFPYSQLEPFSRYRVSRWIDPAWIRSCNLRDFSLAFYLDAKVSDEDDFLIFHYYLCSSQLPSYSMRCVKSSLTALRFPSERQKGCSFVHSL